MKIRFAERRKIIDVVISAVAVMLSIGATIYGVFYFGLNDEYARLGLVLNFFYIAAVTMIWMYFFNVAITKQQFSFWCTACVGVSVLLRDILFPTTLEYYPIQLSVQTLSVLLLCMLTFYYARKDRESYTKRDLWMILIVDTLIAILYNIEMYLEPKNEYTDFFMAEIWIRPTITYGLVVCLITEGESK